LRWWPHRGDGRALLGFRIGGVEHRGRVLGTVNDGTEHQVEFVDQAGEQEGAVRHASTFQQQPLYPEFAVEDLQRQADVDL
jgi:hypothetical protein